MTAVQARVDAALLHLGDLSALEAGTVIAWDGLIATNGAMFSPLDGESCPDLLVLIERFGDVVTVQTVEYDVVTGTPARYGTLSGSCRSVGDVLDEIARRGDVQPVVRFATSNELNESGEYVVPAIAIWTGPVVAAWEVPIVGSRPALRGSRVSWQGRLSSRVTDGSEADWLPPAAPIDLVASADEDGAWRISVGGRTVDEFPGTAAHRTLSDVLAWMTAQLHTLLERAPFEPMQARPFMVDEPLGADNSLVVRMW